MAKLIIVEATVRKGMVFSQSTMKELTEAICRTRLRWMDQGQGTTLRIKLETLTFKFRNLKYMLETSNSIARTEELSLLFSLEMEQFTWENGKEESGQERDTRNGLMDQNILGIGALIKPMALESCSILMEMSMKGVGWKIKRMERENIFTLMEQCTRVNGYKISSTVTEWKFGQMELSMRGSSLRVERRGKES